MGPPRARDPRARVVVDAIHARVNFRSRVSRRCDRDSRVDAWREARRIDDARWLAVGWLGLYHLETSNTRWPKRVSKARLCVFAAAWSRAYA